METSIIVLTEEQHLNLISSSRPVRAIDRVTSDEYVLVKRELYEQLGDLNSQESKVPLLQDVPPAVVLSKQAYLQDLTHLLQELELRGRWVAYAGNTRIGIGNTETALYKECIKRGLSTDEFYVGMILPCDGLPEVLDPPHGEFTDLPL